jgi:GLPGLI family protein
MPAPSGDGGGRRMMSFGAAANAETFRDYDKELSTESRELGPKKYLIDDTLRRIKWKLEEDTMTIGGYLCHKATTKAGNMMQGGMRMFGGGGQRGGGGQNQQRADSMARVIQEMEVVAWFAEQIETPAGPENYFGLPGLILRVDMDNGTMTYTAQSMEPLGKATVKAPTSGKKITREEYRKLMEEQFQGMRPPGGGGMMFRVQQ